MVIVLINRFICGEGLFPSGMMMLFISVLVCETIVKPLLLNWQLNI